MQYFLSEDLGLVNLDEAKIPACDRGFLFGEGIFETILGYDSKILNLSKHLKRLRNSADHFGIGFPWRDEQIEFELQEISGRIAARKKCFKVIITGGRNPQLTAQNTVSQHYLFGGPSATYENYYTNGVSIKRTPHPCPSIVGKHKTTNYLFESSALRAAIQSGFNEVIWTARDGEITECCTANIFFIGRHGDDVEIVTPPISSGILPGITRGLIIDLLAGKGIKVEQRTIFQDELARFDEAFISSAIRGVMAVSRIDRHQFFTRRAQSIFRLVENLYSLWIDREVNADVNWKY